MGEESKRRGGGTATDDAEDAKDAKGGEDGRRFRRFCAEGICSEEGDKMIVLRLHDWDRYADLGELRMAFDYLEQHKHADLAEGRHEIDEDHAFAIMIRHTPKSADECRFETHQRYADIVYIAEGTEMIGYAPAESLEPEGEYDQGKDVAFFVTPEFYTPILLRAGMVAIFYPEDGHMPGAIYERPEPVSKIVVKARVMPLGLPR